MENKNEEKEALKQDGINSGVNNKKAPVILLIEDEYSERMSLKVALEAENFIVDAASDGAEAEAMVKKQYYDIAIVDYRLPDIDGLNLIKKMKVVVPEFVPIVVTAYSSIEIAIDSMRNGAYDYIVKPLDIPSLIKMISKIVEDVKILLKSKQILKEIVINDGSISYETDKDDIIVVTTPDASILSDDSKNILFKKIFSFFKGIKNYYWG